MGQRIGSYRIIGGLGQGGMAAVYLAERADRQFDQRVALKLIRANRATAEAIRRFERERQIVASLEHPNIARLLDGGVCEDGRPYFAMEYIDGAPIDRYCDEQRLSIESRLELFKTVASTVHYAHRNLLVHRDLKPANILVTREGLVKLLDFGIAKILDEEDGTTSTSRGSALWMTPEYASPEQLRGQPVTTASDQYQLGLLLFELLTGRHPHGRARESTWVELVHAICERQVPRPSTLVKDAATRSGVTRSGETRSGATRSDGSHSGEAVPAATKSQRHIERCQISPKRLVRKLRGDLDAIVLKALHKEPEERYGSVEQLSDDVGFYLDGMPVKARPNTLGYRSRKLVARHRYSITLAIALLISLVAYAVTITLQSRQVAAERDRAQAAASEADQVKDFLIDLFESADPSNSLGKELTVRELVDMGTEQITARLDQPPQVRSEMMQALGKVHYHLGSYDKAEPLLIEALDLQRRLEGDRRLKVSQALNDLAMVRWSKGEYAAAEIMYREGLDLRRDLWGGVHPKISGSMHNLGKVIQAQGRYQEAERWLREALTMDREYYGTDRHRDVSYDLNSLGELLFEQGEYDEALELCRHSLEIRLHLYGEDHPLVATSRSQLAEIHLARGELEIAEDYMNRAYDVHRRVLGHWHQRIGQDLTLMARVALEQGNLALADQRCREALEVYLRSVSEEHRYVALTIALEAEIRRRQGNLERSLELYTLSLTRLTGQFSEGHPEIARVYLQRGRSYAAAGEIDAARFDFQSALRLYGEFLGPEHALTRDVEAALANL